MKNFLHYLLYFHYYLLLYIIQSAVNFVKILLFPGPLTLKNALLMKKTNFAVAQKFGGFNRLKTLLTTKLHRYLVANKKNNLNIDRAWSSMVKNY